MDAVIVAGGRGTRLQPLTYTTPKPLLPFCGEPFLSGVIRRLVHAEVDRVLLVVGADTEPFEQLRAPTHELGVELVLVPEPEPLDTAGGVRSVAATLSDPVLVLNGDILTDLDYPALVARHRSCRADATIALTRVEDTSTYGVCVRKGTRIVEFVEKPPPGSLPGQDTVNAGTYVLDPAAVLAFDEGPLSFERDVFPGILAEDGHVEGFVWDGVWADLGTPERYRAGHRLALDGQLSWPSLEALPTREPGIRVAADAHVDPSVELVPPVVVLDEADIGRGATVGPYVVVGQEARIGPDAAVSDSVLLRRARLGEGVVAVGLVAGGGAVVDSGARLGGGNVLGEGEHVTAGAMLRDGQRSPAAAG